MIKNKSMLFENSEEEIFDALMGKTEKRSWYLVDSQGVSNFLPLESKPKQETNGNKLSMQEKVTISLEMENL